MTSPIRTEQALVYVTTDAQRFLYSADADAHQARLDFIAAFNVCATYIEQHLLDRLTVELVELGYRITK